MQEERPRLPPRVRPAEEPRRLRPGRLAAGPARRRQGGDRPQAARCLPRADRAAGRVLRRAGPAAALRRQAPPGRRQRPHPRHPGHPAPGGRALMVILKTPEEIEKIAAWWRVLAKCHRLLRSKARPGITTGELDEAAERLILSQGAQPVFKGYKGFPGSICASPNAMVV